MKQQESPQPMQARLVERAFRWPIQLADYDCNAVLSEVERMELQRIFGNPHKIIRQSTRTILHRLLQPIQDALFVLKVTQNPREQTIRALLRETYHRNKPFWVWSEDEWKEMLGLDERTYALRHGWAGGQTPSRRYVVALAYLFGVFSDFSFLSTCVQVGPLARRIFGNEAVDGAIGQITTILQSWGYEQKDTSFLATGIAYLLLQNRSPALSDLSTEVLEHAVHTCPLTEGQRFFFQISRALFGLGIVERPLPLRTGLNTLVATGTDGSVNETWLMWCDKWRKQSPLDEREGNYYHLLAIGRWLQVHHPEVTSPADFTYDLAAELVAAVNEMKVGEWSSPPHRSNLPVSRVGQPMRPGTKFKRLQSIRTFIRDCQQWEWIPTHINPMRAFRTPRHILNQLGPDPRVVEKSLWAKILWAAMNLEEKDLPVGGASKGYYYPLEMVCAIAVVWCFTALRSDEIARLQVGCIRWQHEDVAIPETGEVLPKDATCFLTVPVNKTLASYTKPVHSLVGERIASWEQIRPPDQPHALDKKTSEIVQFLFFYRGKRLPQEYITDQLIPMLCRKANIPERDSRGQITSHRARATIASMLYNAKDPLDIFQLQQYLGHKYLSSTQYYAQVDPTKLANQVTKAGYLEQNLATIEVLLDQEAVRSGAAARGEPWKYYDLGHGYCLNDFWAECKHRMACARCPFYRPKDSLADLLLEGQANLLRMLEFVQLTEEEKLLVTEGIELHQTLIEQLADTPTPTGLTPRELETRPVGETVVIPVKTVRRKARKTHDE
jgi:integrase